MHPPNQRLGKQDKLSQGTHSQTSYPRVQQENILNKRDCRTPEEQEGTREEEEEEGHGENKVIESEQEV